MNIATKPSSCYAMLAITAIRPERSAELDVAMCEIQHRLGQTGCLHDAADFDGAFALDQFADGVEEGWGELLYIRCQ
jgi:hypothetical protein